jgi:hypothetical protein
MQVSEKQAKNIWLKTGANISLPSFKTEVNEAYEPPSFSVEGPFV